MTLALKGARILVAGGTGFLGSSLVGALAARGANVVVVARHESQTGLRSKRVRTLRVDLVNERDTRIALAELPEFDAALNLASNIPPTPDHDTFEASLENVASAVNLAKSIRKTGHFVYASTCEVYGRPERVPVDESHQVAPKNFYGAGKVASEQYSGIIMGKRSVSYAIARITTVYGPGMPRAIAISRFIKLLRQAKSPTVFAGGREERDYLYIDDAIRGLMQMVTAGAQGTYNLASGRPTRVYDVAKTLCKISGTSLLPVVNEEKGQDFIPALWFSISRAHRDFGFAPTVALEDGLAKTWRSARDQR